MVVFSIDRNASHNNYWMKTQSFRQGLGFPSDRKRLTCVRYLLLHEINAQIPMKSSQLWCNLTSHELGRKIRIGKPRQLHTILLNHHSFSPRLNGPEKGCTSIRLPTLVLSFISIPPVFSQVTIIHAKRTLIPHPNPI